MASRKLVLALAPESREARSVLTMMGLGIFFEYFDGWVLCTVTHHLEGQSAPPARVLVDRGHFPAKSRVGAFADVFEELVGGIARVARQSAATWEHKS